VAAWLRRLMDLMGFSLLGASCLVLAHLGRLECCLTSLFGLLVDHGSWGETSHDCFLSSAYFRGLHAVFCLIKYFYCFAI
jgi:hypothetical protein